MNPSFENKGIKYVFSWPEIALHAEVSRISMNHNASKAMVVFTSTHKNANPHILQTRLNLESTRSRNELAKDLATRYTVIKGKEMDWKGLCEYLCVKTMREYEKGEPIIEISSEDDIPNLEYLIHPIAPLGKPTVIFGDPGSGKSQLAVILDIVCLLPWHNNPLRLGAPQKPTIVLLLDYEADPDDIRRQLVSLAQNMGLGYVVLHYRRCSLPLMDDLESIRTHAEAINASCLIVDSMSLAAGDDPMKMSVATSYFRGLRQTNLTSISLAHTSKDKDTRHKTILGTVLWEAGARSVWEIKGQEEENALNIALFHRKANLSRKFPPQGYRITYDGDSPINVKWQDPRETPEFVEKMTTTDRITELLKEGSMQIEEIMDSLEINRNNAKVSLYRLKKKEAVTRLQDGTWGLVEKVLV